MKTCKMNKARLIVLWLGLGLFFGQSRVWAVTCNNGVGDYCMGSRTIQWWDGCKAVDSNGDDKIDWCEQKYTNDKNITCNAACEYSVPDYGSCTDTTPSDGCTDAVWAYKEGTCCFNDSGGTPGGGCDTTAPKNISADWDQMDLNWTKGSGGASQAVMAAPNNAAGLAAIQNNCGGYTPAADPNCIFKETGLPATQQTYPLTASDYTVGQEYVFKVITVASPLSCSRSAYGYSTYTVTCDAGVPTNLNVNWNNPLYPNQVDMTWTPGGGDDSVSQTVMVGDTQASVKPAHLFSFSPRPTDNTSHPLRFPPRSGYSATPRERLSLSLKTDRESHRPQTKTT
jgi:hypothetical protein